ncbi:MAG: restriction endonuclease subunit S [Phycisphaerae bacterium]|nr:restriction endonuclease subunit S [Phycisphaerae bacterium]
MSESVAQPKAPKGYKQTEVGLIPEDWSLARIDDHASIKTGSRNTQDRVDDGQYPFFVRSQQVERINSYSYEGEAVLTAGDGVGTGKVFHYINGRFDVHQRVYRITEFSDHLDGLYFFYQFSTRFYDRIMSMTAKSSVDSVRMEMIAGMLIPVPLIHEQQAIAEALSDVDGLLGALEALIAKKRAIRQAAMQQLLTGKTRLPGFTGTWETKPFAAVLTRLNVKAHQIQARDYASLGRYPVIDQGQELVIGFSDRSDKHLPCPSGGVIVFGDHTCIVKFVDFDFVVGADGTQVLLAKADGCTRFYAYQLQHSGIEPTGYNRHFKFLKERDFLVPSVGEQQAITAVLSDMDAEIAALERRRDKTKQIKQGMMQQLLTGRIRLVKAEGTK